MKGALQRTFRPRTKADFMGGYWLPLSGGWLPGNSPWNFWQLGWDPMPMGRGSIVTACVAAYAQTIAMCPGTHWRRRADNGRDRVTNSDLSRILRRPNSYQTASDFFLNLVTSLYLHGNAYTLAVRNARYEIAEVHLMDARISQPRIAVDGTVFYALAGNPVVEKQIPAELLTMTPARDVMHIKLNVHEPSRLIGEPPLTAALLDIAASDALVRQALTFVQNQGRPSGIIYSDEDLVEEQLRDLRARWDEMTKGKNAGNTVILGNGLKWEPTAATSRDEQIAELLQISDQRIAVAFRMPLALLSLASGQVPSGATASLMEFWLNNALGFAIQHVESSMSQFFGLAGKPDDYLEFDTRVLLRTNDKDRYEALGTATQRGLLAVNEARAMEHLPAVEYGDEPRMQQQVVPLSFASREPIPAPQGPPAPPPASPPDAGKQPNAAAFADAILAAAERYDERRAA